jgi:signal transduction histidine kinase
MNKIASGSGKVKSGLQADNSLLQNAGEAAKPGDLQGSFQDISGIIRTEKELEKQNNLLKALLDLLPIGVFMVEAPSGEPVVANKTAKQLLGRGIMPDVSKSNLGEVYKAFYIGTEIPYSVDEMPIIKGMTGVKSHADNMEVLRPDGTRIMLEVFGSPVLNNEGEVWASLVSFLDITEKRKAEESLNNINSKLEELNRTKDRIYSIIAHDLKAPFNSILGFSELLSDHIYDYDTDKCREFGEHISSSARQSLSLLENLFAWAQSQSGKIEFCPQQIALLPLIRETMSVLVSSAKMKNINLKILQDTDIEIYADRNMLMTIIRNLISNAIKFTNYGGWVEINVISGENQTEIIVTDNGTGIKEEVRNSLFILNDKMTTKGTANESGSGLGLILCREFVEKHGGRIWVDSEVGKGSSFHFTIPAIVIQ